MHFQPCVMTYIVCLSIANKGILLNKQAFPALTRMVETLIRPPDGCMNMQTRLFLHLTTPRQDYLMFIAAQWVSPVAFTNHMPWLLQGQGREITGRILSVLS